MSKKIIILVIIVIILGGIIGYTLTPKEEKNKISNTISKITESIQTNPIVDEELTFITTGKSNNYRGERSRAARILQKRIPSCRRSTRRTRYTRA